MNVPFFLPSQCFGVKFHVKNVGLTSLTETAYPRIGADLGTRGRYERELSRTLPELNFGDEILLVGESCST